MLQAGRLDGEPRGFPAVALRLGHQGRERQWGKVFQVAVRKSGRAFSLVDEKAFSRSTWKRPASWTLLSRTSRVPPGDWPKEPEKKELGLFARIALESDIDDSTCISLFD
jgi:hypothetical protein